MPVFSATDLQQLGTTPGLAYLATVILLLLVMQVSRSLGAVFFLTAFPATLAHELSHYVLALLSNGRPAGLRLLPQRTARGYVLGSVTCANVRWYNGLLIGLAPLLLLPVAAGLLLWRTREWTQPGTAELAWAYLIACLAFASLPSWQDLRVATASSWLLIAVALAAVLFHLA